MNAPALGGVESARFILYGTPNYAVICPLLYSNNEEEN